MALSFPTWWRGGFPNAEFAMREMLLPFTSQIDPEPEVLAWLPSDYSEHLPLLTVFRIGGSRDPQSGLVDMPQVQVGSICATRAESLELLEFVREIACSYKSSTRLECSNGEVVVVKSVCEVDGPELTPERMPDLRLAYATFQLNLGKRLDQPADYRPQLEATLH